MVLVLMPVQVKVAEEQRYIIKERVEKDNGRNDMGYLWSASAGGEKT